MLELCVLFFFLHCRSFNMKVILVVKNQITGWKRREQREGYKPSVSAKNVSISHCPPGCGREGKSDDEEEEEEMNKERCHRRMKQ